MKILVGARKFEARELLAGMTYECSAHSLKFNREGVSRGGDSSGERAAIVAGFTIVCDLESGQGQPLTDGFLVWIVNHFVAQVARDHDRAVGYRIGHRR